MSVSPQNSCLNPNNQCDGGGFGGGAFGMSLDHEGVSFISGIIYISYERINGSLIERDL